MHTHMRTQHNIQHSAFSIQHSAQEGFIIIQHPAFSIQRRRHSSSFSIQHSAQEGCTIQRRRLHHSAMKIACVGNTTPHHRQGPPRKMCALAIQPRSDSSSFSIQRRRHSAQDLAFSARIPSSFTSASLATYMPWYCPPPSARSAAATALAARHASVGALRSRLSQ